MLCGLPRWLQRRQRCGGGRRSRVNARSARDAGLQRQLRLAHAAALGITHPQRQRLATQRVLRHPAVADKTFLVSIGDRSVGGLCARDPCVGPWQVPVADCAATLLGFQGHAGEAFAMGERTPLALISARSEEHTSELQSH